MICLTRHYRNVSGQRSDRDKYRASVSRRRNSDNAPSFPLRSETHCAVDAVAAGGQAALNLEPTHEQSTVSRYDADSSMVPASCHASLGMLATALRYAGYPRRRRDEMTTKRDRVPIPICPCPTANVFTRIWSFFSSRTSPMLRPAFTRCRPIMTDHY